MVQKTFSIFKEKNKVKVQIGKDAFVLDDSERKALFNCFSNVKESRFLFPSNLYGTAIMYPNGLIAANISVGKCDLAGTKYLVFAYSLTPNSSQYDVNMFMVTNEGFDQYMDALSQ